MKMKVQEARQNGYDKVYFTFDCIGDTILLMTALEYLYKCDGKKILIGTYYEELVEGCPFIDLLDGFNENVLDVKVYQKIMDGGITPIFISATDFIKEKDKYFPRWGKYHMLVNVCNKLGINEEIAVATKIFLTEDEKKQGREFSKNQIAIVSAGNQKYKSIPYNIAQDVVNQLIEEYNFVQLGSEVDPLLENVLDRRGKVGLRGTASILYNSDLFIGGIGGLMHMARAVDCRSVIAYSTAEPLVLENYACNINVVAPEPKCSACGERKEFPYLVDCKNNYSCIMGIRSEDIIAGVKEQFKRRTIELEVDKVHGSPARVEGIEDYIKRFGKIKG